MGRILQIGEERVLIEPYGTYEDWYDLPDEEQRKWVRKDLIEAIDDTVPVDWDMYLNTEDVLEITMPTSQAGRLLT